MADWLRGTWYGVIEVPGAPLRFRLTVTADGASLDVPTQMIAGLPIGELRAEPGAVTFTVPGLPGEPVFAGRRTGDGIAGELTQSGARAPFTLSRTESAPPRPQYPAPPFPYSSIEVQVERGALRLAGTLTVPDGAGPFPAVVLITGSGAHDRDESIAEHKPFLVLADALSRAGIAVLRTDDRGVGGSGGDRTPADYPDLADDALACGAHLAARPEIAADRIGLLGHSQGGYLAALAGQRAQATVAVVVLLTGPAVPGEEILRTQNAELLTALGAGDAAVAERLRQVDALLDRLSAGDFAGALDVYRTGISPAPGANAFVATLPPLVAHDPLPSLRALRMPVLALYGAKDLQVSAARNEPALRAALAGNPDATVRTLPGLNHLLQPARRGTPHEYADIPTTIDPGALTLITTWLTERLNAG